MRELWSVLEETLGAKFADTAEIRKLSRSFTEERAELTTNYLEDPKKLAAYLAYYVPLNFLKVTSILRGHAENVWPKSLASTVRWLDFGCGPAATASLAALAELKATRGPNAMPVIEIDLVDTQDAALRRAEELLAAFASKIGVKTRIATHKVLPITDAKKASARYDMALVANVLNELPASDAHETDKRETLLKIWDVTRGALVVLEPGHRVSSQRLIRFRSRLLKDVSAKTAEVVGPCLHSQQCPVYRTRHWCHFSEPVSDERLIQMNLKIFNNPRGWLKFSYFIVKRGKPKAWDRRFYRAIGDLHLSRGRNAIDLCRPGEKKLLVLPANLPPPLKNSLVRGAAVELDDEGYRVTAAVPLTPRKRRTRSIH